jgi:hypothetical protein
LSSDTLAHPADKLATALNRASGLLMLLADLYTPADDSFSGGNAFVSHAVVTASDLLAEAKNALADLHYSCDLTLLDHPDQPHIDLSLIQPVESTIKTENAETSVAPAVAEQNPDDYAKSYLELLQKLTDAEVFAAEQHALAAPGSSPDLLPMLRSLREDLKKLHNAA